MSHVRGQTALQMDEDQSHMTEMICDLALEIIFLLTGEKHAAVKMASIESLLRGVYPPLSVGGSLSQTPITKPPSHSQVPESNNQKILEVTNKIIELLAGEVSAAGNSSMKENDGFLDTKVEDLDGSEIPPERSGRPPRSQGSARCNQEIPLHDQVDDEIKIIEIKEEPLSGDEWCVEEVSLLNIPHCYQDENQSDIKPEEEEQVSGEEQCKEISLGWVHIQDIRKQPPDIVSNGGKQRDDNASDSSKKTSNHSSIPTQTKPVKWTDCWASKPEQVQVVEKPYACPECGKSFSTKASLIGHEQVHIGEQPYSCSECGRCFSQKFSLVSHRRVHKEKTSYVCTVCGRAFYQKSHLTSHERVHTGEKPYSCSVCGKSFSDRTVLVRHARIHTGEKPYSCSECGKCFTQRANLTRHEQVHAGKNPQ